MSPGTWRLDHLPETPTPHPSRNISLLSHTAYSVVYSSTLQLCEHTSQSPSGWQIMWCATSRLEHFACQCEALQSSFLPSQQPALFQRGCSISLDPTMDDMERPPANPQWTMEHEWEIILHCFKPKLLRFEVCYCGITYPILTDTLPFFGGRSRWILLGVGNSAEQRERTRSPSSQPHHHASEKPSAVGKNEP